MIYVTLPNFFNHFDINNKIVELTKLHPEYFKLPVSFYYATGNFPYCYWNGGFNNNSGLGAYYKDFITCSDLNAIPLRFNCTNMFLEEKDYDNTMANLILSTNENGSNAIEIQDLKLYVYLKEKYPNYTYIFSKEAGYAYNLTPELINSIIDQKLFKFVGIPEDRATDFEFLSKINNKRMIEVPLNTSCRFDCPYYKDCKVKEHRNQYDYFSLNLFKQCSKSQDYDLISPLITVEDIKEKYIPMGITHFSLAETEMNGNTKDYVRFLVKYFIKEEYGLEAYQKLLGDLPL